MRRRRDQRPRRAPEDVRLGAAPRDPELLGRDAGRDTLLGRDAARDTLLGRDAGRDTLLGRDAGRDTLLGRDAGRDTLLGRDAGRDTLLGRDAGRDTLLGRDAGRDTLLGRDAGRDTLLGRDGVASREDVSGTLRSTRAGRGAADPTRFAGRAGATRRGVLGLVAGSTRFAGREGAVTRGDFAPAPARADGGVAGSARGVGATCRGSAWPRDRNGSRRAGLDASAAGRDGVVPGVRRFGAGVRRGRVDRRRGDVAGVALPPTCGATLGVRGTSTRPASRWRGTTVPRRRGGSAPACVAAPTATAGARSTTR